MNNVKQCTLCGGESEPAGMSGKVPLAKCRECGFAYAAVPDREIVAANQYGEEVKDRYQRVQSAFDMAWFDWLVVRFPGTNVLDIGCGNGLLLRRYQQVGCNVAGMDPDPWAQTDDYRVFTDMSQAPRDFYDVVMCTSVLEHIPYPAAMLTQALAATRPGGVVYMTVPNFGSWAARCKAECMRPLKRPGHCNFFTARDLRHLCERAGAWSYRVRSYGMPLMWDFWRRHRRKVTASSTSITKGPQHPNWKHRLVVKAYYWSGIWRGDKLELCVTKVA
jgi:SAM-dependent methyltransferase